MRILSQTGIHEGIIDVPYEQISIEQRENEIWCGYFATLDKHCVGKCFAKYSTAEKAQKAMEMLRNVYYESERERVYKDGVSYLTTHFQFPANHEIEV